MFFFLNPVIHICKSSITHYTRIQSTLQKISIVVLITKPSSDVGGLDKVSGEVGQDITIQDATAVSYDKMQLADLFGFNHLHDTKKCSLQCDFYLICKIV